MKNYVSQHPNTQTINNLYSSNSMMSNIEKMEFEMSKIHTVESSYNQQKKLKEILNKNLD